jgi:hypothetical protein
VEATTVSDRVFAPLIIGITGKRDLEGKDEAVRAALSAAFDCLDRSFPTTPKILLSALAEGADMLAAEEALRRADRKRESDRPACPWQVVALLPLPLKLYLQDTLAPSAECPCTPCTCDDLLRANSRFLGESSLRSPDQGISLEGTWVKDKSQGHGSRTWVKDMGQGHGSRTWVKDTGVRFEAGK